MSASRSRLVALVLFVASMAFALPQRFGDVVVDGGLVLGPLLVACLLLATRGLTPGRAFLLVWPVAALGWATGLYWIFVAEAVVGSTGPVIGAFMTMAMCTAFAAFAGLFVAGASALGAVGLATPPVLAALWAALDHLRAHVFTGFPYGGLGYTQADNPGLLAWAPYTGVYGLGFAAALAGAGLAALWQRRRREAAWGLGGYAALCLAGWMAAMLAPPAEGDRVRIAVLQGNIEQGRKWDPEWAEEIFQVYERLTRAAAWEGAKVVVWPEAAVPESPDASLDSRERLARLAREAGTDLVVGAVGIDGFDPATGHALGQVVYRDSAFLFSSAGELLERYDKAHLVPFGEYVPESFGRLVGAIATGGTEGVTRPGPGARAIALPALDGDAVGTPICYELVFPDLTRRFARDGARLLLALTNDGWYGRTGAPNHFFEISVMRAAEARTPMARAANSGISAIVDARGRVGPRLGLDERGKIVADVALRGGPPSFYARHGDVFAFGCWGALALVSVAGVRRARRA